MITIFLFILQIQYSCDAFIQSNLDWLRRNRFSCVHCTAIMVLLVLRTVRFWIIWSSQYPEAWTALQALSSPQYNKKIVLIKFMFYYLLLALRQTHVTLGNLQQKDLLCWVLWASGYREVWKTTAQGYWEMWLQLGTTKSALCQPGERRWGTWLREPCGALMEEGDYYEVSTVSKTRKEMKLQTDHFAGEDVHAQWPLCLPVCHWAEWLSGCLWMRGGRGVIRVTTQAWWVQWSATPLINSSPYLNAYPCSGQFTVTCSSLKCLIELTEDICLNCFIFSGHTNTWQDKSYLQISVKKE